MVLSLLDIVWWRHRRLTCRIIGWLKRSDGHDWSARCYPSACTWCGVTGWPGA